MKLFETPHCWGPHVRFMFPWSAYLSQQVTSSFRVQGKWFVHCYPPVMSFASCYSGWKSSVTCPSSSQRSTYQVIHTLHVLHRCLSKVAQPKEVVFPYISSSPYCWPACVKCARCDFMVVRGSCFLFMLNAWLMHCKQVLEGSQGKHCEIDLQLVTFQLVTFS